jgi:hypothetical protein
MKSNENYVAFPVVNLKQILVPWSECLGVSLGPQSCEIAQEMRKREFDYAPVFSSNEPRAGVVGLISQSRLENLIREKILLSENDEGIIPIDSAEIWEDTRLDVLLRQMAERPAWIVFYEGDAGEYGTYHICCGLVTRSDLNKHPIRTIVYEIFAMLETALADLVMRSTGDPFTWIRRLDEDSQARILGYWELSKLQNVNTGPVVGATLSELLRVVAKNKLLCSNLAYKSRSSFDDAVGCLPAIRNQVMHPVRPLISNADSCVRLERAIRETIRLTESVRGVLQLGKI